jgi:type IV secretion system protein VirB10
MPVGDIGDPRLQELFGPEAAAAAGVRPVVRLARSGPSAWAIAAFAVAAAILLFWLLDSRREAQPEPQVRPGGDAATFSPEPPPLYIPPAPPVQPDTGQVAGVAPAAPPATGPAPAPETRPQVLPAPVPQPMYQQPLPQPVPTPTRAAQPSTGPALVIDTGSPAASQGSAGAATASAAPGSQWGGRARAGTLANRSNTVPQGAMIPAVLETAFNSTSAGLARAVVSRDVRGFDGSRVLIPRGSRLVGDYGREVAAGQNRAVITWTRLIRPDGVTVALDSPATDTVGRGGIRARVDTHFWTRLGDALLGSVSNIGSGLATRAATGSVIVSMPGAVQQSAAPAQPGQVTPTLSLRAGTSISIFVARDLEFPDRAGGE